MISRLLVSGTGFHKYWWIFGGDAGINISIKGNKDSPLFSVSFWSMHREPGDHGASAAVLLCCCRK